MDHYLIESRLFGAARLEMKRLILEVDERFKLGKVIKYRPVPHITFAGPFTTNQEDRLVYDFTKICEDASLMGLKFNGFGTFDDMQVVFVNVMPSTSMQKFRWNLSKKISPYCNLSIYDKEKKFNFHATIAKDIPQARYDLITNYVYNHSFLSDYYYLTRITLLKNSKILYEFDFLLQQLLNRKEALDKSITKLSFNLLNKRLLKFSSWHLM